MRFGRVSPLQVSKFTHLRGQYHFGKSVIHCLARTWAIIGYILFFTIDGLRRKNFECLKGLLSALREPLPDSEI